MQYSAAKYIFLCVLRFVQVPTLTLNCTNAIIHQKTRLFESFTEKKKNQFVQLSTLTLKCTNAIFHHKARLFECFEVENPVCESVNSDIKLHKCGIPQQNTSFYCFRNENQLCANANSDVKLHKCNNSSQNTSF